MIYIELKIQKNIIKSHSKDADYNKIQINLSHTRE